VAPRRNDDSPGATEGDTLENHAFWDKQRECKWCHAPFWTQSRSRPELYCSEDCRHAARKEQWKRANDASGAYRSRKSRAKKNIEHMRRLYGL